MKPLLKNCWNKFIGIQNIYLLKENEPKRIETRNVYTQKSSLLVNKRIEKKLFYILF